MEFKTIAANFLLTNLVTCALADSHIEQVLLHLKKLRKWWLSTRPNLPSSF